LRDKFIGKRPEYAGKRFLVCGTPVYSTSGEVLDALAVHGFETAKLLSRRAQLEKDNGTYYISYDYNKDGSVKKVKGMLQHVGPDGIVHHSLNTCATVTGRLSSSNPNLQNLPRDGTSKVKQMFTSRFGDDGVIIEVDYSALEVVMLAALSGDEGLLKELIAGTDMHCLRLAAKLGEAYESVVEKCNNREHPDHKRYKQMRTDIKAPSFAAQYGASASGIAFATGVSLEYAQGFLDTEAKLFPRAIAFRQVIRDAVTKTGDLPEGLQRECDDAGFWTVYRRGYWQSPGGTRYSFRQYSHYRDGKQIMDYKDTQIANYWCQGESGYMMTLSAGRVIRWLISKNFFDGKAYLINNVHDALYLDCHKTVAREAGLSVAAIMQDAPKYMSEQLGYNIAHVPFPAKAEMGPSMYDKTEIH
jgi:DNA polymerase I-like protein with 3'-5' exonuclease and polymerase domains